MSGIQTTGFGSIWRKQQEARRTCMKCGSVNLKYDEKNKFTCECENCGNIEPRRIKKFKGTKVKPLKMRIDRQRELKVIFQEKQRGVIRGERYISHRNKTHFCHKYVGFGITEEIFEYIKTMGVSEIVIIYTKVDGTQEVYYSETDTWDKYGKTDKLGGFEKQIFLERKYMRLEG